MAVEEAEILMTRSQEYLEEAERLVREKRWDIAMSSLHLHCELKIKSLLLKFGATYPRTHSLRSLIKVMSEFEPKVSVLLSDENNLLRLSRLEEGYISSRYLPVRYSEEDIMPLLKFVKGAFNEYIS